MLIGTKSQLRTLHLDDFLLNFNSTPMEVVSNARYLGLFINSDSTWDNHVSHMCKQLYYMYITCYPCCVECQRFSLKVSWLIFVKRLFNQRLVMPLRFGAILQNPILIKFKGCKIMMSELF